MTTEQKILKAARIVFHKKGFAGARMEEIAREADINQALLHYYYRSKDKLFEEVFNEALDQFIPRLIEILESPIPLDMKVYKVVDFYCSILIKNQDVPLFVLAELRQNPERMVNLKFKDGELSLGRLSTQLKEEAESGRIQPIEVSQFILNLWGLTIFPFMVDPIMRKIFDMDDQDFNEMIEQRKKLIPDLILTSLKANQDP